MSPTAASKRYAKLEVVPPADLGQGAHTKEFVRLIASNGETLMHGEDLTDGERGRKAIIEAMRDIVAREDQRDYAISALMEAGALSEPQASKIVDDAVRTFGVG